MPEFSHKWLDLFIKPSWKNILIMLLLWNIGLLIYAATGTSVISLGERIIFYYKYSWLNLVLWYVLSVWIISPNAIRVRYPRMIWQILIVTAIYIVARVVYNGWVDDSYYTTYSARNEPIRRPWNEIIRWELFRALEFIIISLAYSFLFVFLRAEYRRRRLETDKLKAELAALRYQLNPHFLFNSLNNIYYLAIIKSDLTVDAIVRLSDMLRYLLDQKSDMVPLQHEIKYLEEFIDFHRLRFPDDHVVFEKMVAPGMEQRLVPALCLLTFAENAFKHGQPQHEGESITIKLRADGNGMNYEVTNPLSQGISLDKSSSIGLDNLRRRLDLLFPNGYQLSTEQIDGNYHAKLYLHAEPYDTSHSY